MVNEIANAVCNREIVLLGELPTHGETRAFQLKAGVVELLVNRWKRFHPLL